MKMTMRWYGEDDKVTLENLRQIPGLDGVVTAVYSVKSGGVWPEDDVAKLVGTVHSHGLTAEVIESVPVHEDIKRGLNTRDMYIENYVKNIKTLSEHGVKVICYNFMPVFDWTRSQLDKVLPDGSTTLVYYQNDVDKMDPLSGELALPGWDASYEKTEMAELIGHYKEIGADGLWKNIEYFVKAVMPYAEKYRVKMAIHPDDPPWPIFGLPRIITDEQSIDRFLSLYDSEYNGLTLCAGSLGSSDKNNIPAMAAKYARAKRAPFIHLRNVKTLENNSFEESAHMSRYGSLDMVAIIKALHDNGFDGYIRPDHGRMIWGETGRAGYGLYDRALGSVYLNGIIDSLESI